jgi:hypothetical protein
MYIVIHIIKYRIFQQITRVLSIHQKVKIRKK